MNSKKTNPWEEEEALEGYIYEFWKFLPVPLCYVNSLHFILDINDEMEQSFGYTQVEMAGEEIKDFFLDSSSIKELEEEIAQKNSIKKKAIFLTKDKQEIPVVLSAMGRKDKQGYFIGYFLAISKSQGSYSPSELEKQIRKKTIVSDTKLTALRDSRLALLNMLEDAEEAKKEVEEERKRTLSIVANFVDGLILFDMDHKVALINAEAEKLFSIKNQEIAGQSIFELVQIPSMKSLAGILSSPKTKEIKEIFKKELKINENLILEASTISILKEEGETEVLVILHDVTREKLVEKMKTEFVTIAAHQLRTPLSAIKWTIRMLADGDLGELNKGQKEFLDKIYFSNERMISLINDLLDVTRIEEGRYTYNLVQTSFADLVQKTITIHEDEFKKKNIKLSFNRPSALPKSKIDVEKMSLVLQNFFDNAVKYTKENGEVIISLEHNKKENEVIFSMKDTGIGIDQNEKNRIFTRFFRGANALRVETEGSGLGLYIAKNIIEAHHGKCWFESEMNKGSVFSFSLPVEK